MTTTHVETPLLATTVLHVGGLHYASEQAVVEGVLGRRPGVLEVDTNPVAQIATVTFDPELTSVARLREWVQECGYHCAGQSMPGCRWSRPRRAQRRLLRTVGAGSDLRYGCLMSKHSMKMMWGCVAIVVLAVVVSLAVGSAGYLLFVVPCMLMMGVMMWMMMGGAGGSRGGDQK